MNRKELLLFASNIVLLRSRHYNDVIELSTPPYCTDTKC